VSDQILFEHPLNEKCRTFLRLSHLFEQFEHHLTEESTWSTRASLSALLNVAAVLARADIKSDLIKEMEAYRAALSAMADKRGVDRDRLEQILSQIQGASEAIQQIPGQLGNALRKNEFLSAVTQRSGIPGGSFDFDLPQLHHWLQSQHTARVAQLRTWHAQVAPVQEAVDLALSLIRTSTTPQAEVAKAGFYQRNLQGGSAAQMVRVYLPRSDELYPEVSGGKHRFNIRFLESRDLEHPAQTKRDVEFRLTTCLL
jgi:cell division protein ZapD